MFRYLIQEYSDGLYYFEHKFEPIFQEITSEINKINKMSILNQSVNQTQTVWQMHVQLYITDIKSQCRQLMRFSFSSDTKIITSVC